MKTLLISFLCLCLSIGLLYSQTNYSKFSMSLEAGVNRFDGDVNQTIINTFPASMWNTTFGLNAEYKLSNQFGLSVSGYYIPINAETYLNTELKQIKTKVTTGSINVTEDLTHLVFPLSKSKLTINTSVGLGYAFYTYNDNTVITETDKYFIEHPSAGISPQFPVTSTYGLAFTLPVSLYVKYKLSNHIDIGLKTTYICFNKDNVEGIWNYKGVTNDGIGMLTAMLTYNFTKHAKIPVKTSTTNNTSLLPTKLTGNGNYTIQKSLSDSLLCCKSDTIEPIIFDNYNSVFFDFDKYNLDNQALAVIYKIARILLHNPELKVSITGYCDWMGEVPYNFTLSEQRVLSVKNELVEMYQINPDRLKTNGKGKLDNPKRKYRPNRRCDFTFY